MYQVTERGMRGRSHVFNSHLVAYRVAENKPLTTDLSNKLCIRKHF